MLNNMEQPYFFKILDLSFFGIKSELCRLRIRLESGAFKWYMDRADGHKMDIERIENDHVPFYTYSRNLVMIRSFL